MGLALMLAEAEWNGDTGIIRLLTCPVCGRITFAGGGRRVRSTAKTLIKFESRSTPVVKCQG
ncbi:hypothetical protein [Streptomyces sp. S.PNR 29]|uniref:hypothetical protein n=1 Tax=Streptomyces sp. S.PNR 29 TaxID=2973805 RepID=UPI0025B0D195|nr:hypothetical protein [Streptomyces sp. S.PNR 29]MDN0201222.1 hypothetical protein [Streptomyces sp. S.PNR 29]